MFVIIALGETLIVAAGTVTDAVWTNDLLVLAVLAVAITCGLWWSYFPRAKPVLDQALESRRGAEQAMMARDVFSLIHFPMMCGVIAYAASVEVAVAHPDQPLPLAARVALAVGLTVDLEQALEAHAHHAEGPPRAALHRRAARRRVAGAERASLPSLPRELPAGDGEHARLAT